MNHADFGDEMYDLYLLGVLEADQSEQIEAHLRDECQYCVEKVRQAERLTAALAGIAKQVEPPASLRRRVLASVAPPKRPTAWIYAVAALAAACVVLVVFAAWSSRLSASMQDQLAKAQAERNELRSALEMMSRSETRAVQFGNLPNAPHGRVFVSNDGGVVFVGTGLPDLPAGKSFELWIVPTKGAPQPAGVFRPDSAGGAVDIATAHVGNAGAAAVAVSVEPPSGSASPTTKPFLIVPLS